MRTLLVLLLSLPFALNAQQWNWAASGGGGGNVDFCYGIATDSEGNAYWVGSVSGTVDFGCGTLTAVNTVAGFIAKRNAAGTCLWVRGITVGSNDAWAYGVAIDDEDRIYVTGSYNGNASFGDGVTLGSLGSDDIFLARYDTDGTCLWARRAGSSGSSDEARGVAVSEDGAVFIAGFSGGTTIGFDGINIPNSANWRQLVIARYDSTGTVQWARASTGNGQGKSCRAISVSGDRLFVTGQIGGSAASYDGVALTPGSMGTHLYVLATDLAGNGIWARSYGSGDHEGMGISADTLGNVFVAARMLGNLFLPDDTLTSVSNTSEDILVMKLDAQGELQWAKSTGSAQRDLAWGVDTDGQGNAYVAMQFNGTIDLFGTPVSALGSEDALIAKFQGDGSVVWWSRPSNFQRDIPLCIHRQTVEPNALYFGGYYWGVITYGSSTLDDIGNGDAMVVGGRDTTFHASAFVTPTCVGACNGTAQAFVNGDGPFSYLWSTGATTPFIEGLCQGVYTLQVVDANGQALTNSILLEEREPLGLTIQVNGDSLWVEGGNNWVWELDGFQVGAGQPYHIALTTGTYQVFFSDDNGCLSGSPAIIVVLNVGVEENGSGVLRAWPNPMGEVLFVDGLHIGDRLELRDALGRVIWQGRADGVRVAVPTNGLAAGSYLLRTESGAVVKLVR